MIFNQSGGMSLNFKVVGGTSAPSNPKENTIWVNTSTEITSWDFSANEPHRRSGNKNLIVYPYHNKTRTENGITFTDNGDGTVKVNGTASGTAYFFCANQGIDSKEFLIEPGTYTLSGGAGSDTAKCALVLVYTSDDWKTTTVRGVASNTVTFTITHTVKARAHIGVYAGATVSNLVVKPQLERGSTATSFVKGDATGQVWIKTGGTSNVKFNALKKNGIEVDPGSVYQYISGAWAGKTAKSYIGGKWVDWFDGYLYNAGNDATAITGGWKVELVGRNDNTGDSYSGKITKNTSNITITGVGSKGCIYRPVNKIDLSGKKKLLFNGTLTPASSGGKYVLVGVWSAFGTKFEDNLVAYFDATSTKTGTQTIDVSSLNGFYYIGVAIHGLESKIIMNSMKIE